MDGTNGRRAMYKIERTGYGFKLTFGDTIETTEMTRWVAESEKALQNVSGEFGVFVDMRTLKPLTDSTQAEMEKGQKLYKGKGMTRSVVVVESAIVAMQFKRLARQSGIYNWERYIASSDDPGWEAKGLAWIRNAVDPDLKAAA